MVLVHDTSSEYALQMYEVSLKYLTVFKLWSGHDIVMDSRTDGRKGKNNMSADSSSEET